MIRARIKAIQAARIKTHDGEIHEFKKGETKSLSFRTRNEKEQILALKEGVLKEVPMVGAAPAKRTRADKSMLTEEEVKDLSKEDLKVETPKSEVPKA